MKKYKGLFVPNFKGIGILGRMMSCCENTKIMQNCCSDLKCQECLFDYEDKRKQSIFSSWEKKESKKPRFNKH